MAVTSRVRQYASNWTEQVKEDMQVEHSKNDDGNTRIWSNQDMDPTPPEKRTWAWHNYLLYFVATGFNNWQGGSSVIGVGLGWKLAIAIAFLSTGIAGCVQALNSKAAARYHIGFPALARSVWGMWGSTFQVTVRAILASVWYATKTFEAASYLDIMMTCIFGHAYTDIPNHVPESIGYRTRDFLCYFLVWLIATPFLFRRPHQLRWFFTVSCVLSFPSIFGLFIYCITLSKGNLGLNENVGTQKLDKGAAAWLAIYSLTSSISNGSTYVESVSDIARWAKTRDSVVIPTLFCNILFNPMSAVLGILGTSALQSYSGQTLWKPWDVMGYMLEQHPGSSGVKFGVFLLAFTWAFQTLSQNISSNMIPFGSDASMLWPKHLTMTRGYIIVHLLAWVICPWKIYVSASTFLNFMGSYGILMGPAVSIMLCEYWIVSRGNIFVPSIYIGSKTNPNYWYHGGWNVQAYCAWITAVGICLVGFINKIGVTVPAAGEKLGYLGWLLTFFTGGIVYVAINKFWPHPNVKNFQGLRWEELADRNIEQYNGVEVFDNEQRGVAEMTDFKAKTDVKVSADSI